MIPHSILISGVLATFMCAAFPAVAQTIAGPVTHVRDGDTLVIAGQPVRLNGLHAPEMREPGGHAARQWMVDATAGKIVTCHLDGSRTHDRAVGVCYVGGVDLAVGLVSAGLARDCARWSKGRYARYETPAGRMLRLPAYCRPR